MFCNYYKNEEREWISFSLDCDEEGIEILTVVKNIIKKNLVEAVNLDQFKKAERLNDMVSDIQKALDRAEKHEEA